MGEIAKRKYLKLGKPVGAESPFSKAMQFFGRHDAWIKATTSTD
jgi:hypothetical protein